MKKQEQIITPEQTAPKIPEIMPEPLQDLPEMQLSDGQTTDLPEYLEQPEDGSFQNFGAMNPTNNAGSRYYTEEEFNQVFGDFMAFLKNPEVATDMFGNIHEKGQRLAAGKVYEMASKYKFLRFLIDRQTQVLHDMLLLGIWAACETEAICMNWTGISLFGKVKIWLRGKIKQKAEESAKQGKRSVWAFLGLRGAEKAQNPENSPAN